MADTFDLFIRHRRYVNNYSENTINTYKLAWKIWKRLMGEAEFSKATCTEFIARMRESGITPSSCNVHIKAINGYLIWLAENEYIPEPIHIKHIKAPQKVVEPIPDEDLKRIVRWKPRKRTEQRLYALLCLLTDTGVRIDEALSLKRPNVDFDNLLIKIRGKGDKERLVPFSLECRKVLFKFLSSHKFEYVFPASTGSKLMYGNVHRDVQLLLKKLGCKPAGLHRFRHAFASGYLRNGGNLMYLSRQLGHVNLSTTKRYIQITTDDLSREQALQKEPVSFVFSVF